MTALVGILIRVGLSSLSVTYFVTAVASLWRSRAWQVVVYLGATTVIIAHALLVIKPTGSQAYIVQCIALSLVWTGATLGAIALARWMPQRRTLILRAAIAGLLLSWLVLKSAKLRGLFAAGVDTHGIALIDSFPLGASYAMVKLVHVLADSAKAHGPKVRGATLYAMILFPATYASGPMHRYEEFAQDFDCLPGVRRRDWAEVIRRVIWGTFKASVVAAYLGEICNPVLAEPMAYAPWALWVAMYAYALYLYYNFVGVSDIAIGVSAAFGIRTPENFDAPYMSRNIQDFWRRWHMTFTRWLQAYIFMPLCRRLTRTRLRGRQRLISGIGYLVAFAFCGLWHGDGVGFLVWGAYHGMGLLIYTALPKNWKAPSEATSARLCPKGWAWWAVTFQFVCFGWILFACPLSVAITALGRMLGLV